MPAQVYPCGRGGTCDRITSGDPLGGLSPRTRGNPDGTWETHHPHGSIPADAGESRILSVVRIQFGVYPRGRGGIQDILKEEHVHQGLSPRTRGNLFDRSHDAPRLGSIPADAGESVARCADGPVSGVYPRGRGGIYSIGVMTPPGWGLSPRTRGNPRRGHPRYAQARSIPADAGESRFVLQFVQSGGVYPRGRGGIAIISATTPSILGLSPRTRGNLHGGYQRPAGLRSIPADAGESTVLGLAASLARVYPRGRGGIQQRSGMSQLKRGLSPRTRGNPPGIHTLATLEWSIPADAGESAPPGANTAAAGVYPRGRGGICRWLGPGRQVEGLSPRTRGNLSMVTK